MASLFRTLHRRLRALWRRDVITDEITDEMVFHLDQRTEALERQGLSRSEARRVAMRRFGNVARLRDEGYEVRGGGFIETVWQDVRFALHLMQRRRAFSIAAVLTLALGIGLTTALLSVVDAAWLRPLPFPNPDRIMTVVLTTDERGEERRVPPSQTELRLLRRASQVVAAIGEWHGWPQRQVLDTGEPERAKVLQMPEGYVEVYGVAPILGRTLMESDGRAGARPVHRRANAATRRGDNHRRWRPSAGVPSQRPNLAAEGDNARTCRPARFRRRRVSAPPAGHQRA